MEPIAVLLKTGISETATRIILPRAVIAIISSSAATDQLPTSIPVFLPRFIAFTPEPPL